MNKRLESTKYTQNTAAKIIQLKKWAKEMNRHLKEEDTQMTIKHMKKMFNIKRKCKLK